MIELPEAGVLGGQIAEQLKGLRVVRVEAMSSPHKFAFWGGDPQDVGGMLLDRVVTGGYGAGGHAVVELDGIRLALSDGVAIRYHAYGDKLPTKHQLLLGFEDDSYLSMTVRMYGFFLCFQEGDCPNDYVRVALERPSPLTSGFTPEYFLALVKEALQQKKNLSVKAMLATEQRIPGLGNGVLQDILFSARIHPKRKAAGLSDAALEALYDSTKRTLAQMAIQGGRDTESDIYGVKGGYQTILSSKRAGQPCPVCGETVVKEAYMGGSVYYCPTCQALEK